MEAGTIGVMEKKTRGKTGGKKASAKKPASRSAKATSKTVKKEVKKDLKKSKSSAASATKKSVVSQKVLLWGIMSLAILLFVVFAGVWYFKVHLSPERVFWSMINDTLSTSGISRTVVQTSPGGGSTEQSQLNFGVPTTVLVKKTIQDSSSGPTSTVVIEGLGTDKADFQRYLKVDRLTADGKPLDYSPVYGLWIKTNESQGGTSTDSTILSQALLGAVLIGNLNPQDRKAVVQLLHNGAYEIDTNNVITTKVGNHKVYTYNVKVALNPYAKALVLYASTMGLASASTVNPSNYGPNDKLEMKISVDKMSRQLVRINYTNADIVENYGSHGIFHNIADPDKITPVKTFQQKLQQITGTTSS